MDLSFLPDELRAAARFTRADGSGEVMWPRECVAEVIERIAEQGIVIVGLDYRSDGDRFQSDRQPNDLPTEIPLASTVAPDAATAGRNALEALSEAPPDMDDFRWILVTCRR